MCTWEEEKCQGEKERKGGKKVYYLNIELKFKKILICKMVYIPKKKFVKC